jgi:hypothetical protein
MLVFILKFIGWAFVLIPTIIFVGVSVNMIRGAGKDDPLIKSLTLIGVTIFLLGAVSLMLIYTSETFL